MKKISAILATCMLVGTLGSVPAYAAPQEVLLFETFEGASSAWNNQDFIFQGKTGLGVASWANNFSLATSSIDEVSYDSFAKVTGDSYFKPRLFGKVIDSGKVHISYSYKTGNSANSAYLMAIDAVDDTENGVDGYDVTQASHAVPSMVFAKDGKINVTDNSALYGEGTDGFAEHITSTENAYDTDTWYKADVLYDLDSKTYKAYVNGVFCGEGECRDYIGIKGLGKREGSWITVPSGEAYIDDIYVHEYDDNETITLATEGVKKLPDGTYILSLAPSEYIKDFSEYSIILSDAATGDDFLNNYSFEENTSVANDGKLTLHLPADVAGREFVILGSDITGSTSGATEIAPLLIRIPASTASDGNKSYYYMNESFDAYKGGTAPAGWTLGVGSVLDSRWLLPAGSQASQALSAVNGADGKGVKISGNSDMLYYYFPSITPVSGQFTIEFDVNRGENADWKLNYVLYEDYKAAQEAGVNAAERMSFEMIKTDTDGNVLYAAERSSEAVDTEADNAAGVWEHIKIDVDMGSNTYDITVGNVSKKVETTFKGLLSSGIMGIGINGTDTAFDNFKVYKNTNSYLSDNFNTYSSKKIQVGWDGTTKTVDGEPITDYTTTDLGDYLVGREDIGVVDIYRWYKFFSSNGWIDPDVTKLSALDAAGISDNENWLGNTKAVALTPAEGSEVAKGQLLRAEESSPANYWTKAKAESGDKVLMLAPRLIDENRSTTEKQQRRIVKYFDRAVTPGTPLTIEFLCALPGVSDTFLSMPFGISLIEDGQDAADKNNLLLGYTGNGTSSYQITGNNVDSCFRAMVAPNTDISFKELLANDADGSSVFKYNNIPLSEGGYRKDGWWVGESTGYPAKAFLPAGSALQKITVTVTPNSDSTTTIGYKLAGKTVDIAGGSSFVNEDVAGTVTVNRDFTSKTFTGIAFDIMDMSWTSYGNGDTQLGVNWDTSSELADGAHCIMIDELNVSETSGKDESVHVKGINALDYADVKTSVEDTVASTAKALEIEFSAPVSETVIGKEGMVALVNANTNENVLLSGELSSDSTVYTIYPDKLEAETNYNLIVSNNIEFAPNNANQLTENYVKSFKCVAAKDINIYDSMIANAIQRNGAYTYENIKPAKATTVNTIDGTPTKLYINGVSAKDNTSLLGIIAYYATNELGNVSLVKCQFVPIDVAQSGEFKKFVTLELPSEEFDSIAAFVWSDDNTYQPLCDAARVDYTKPTVEE